MQYGSKEYLLNMEMAKRMNVPEKTVAVLMDERPGFQQDAAQEIITAIMEAGYYVHSITVDELCNKTITTLGFLLVIPHAESVPAVCAQPIENFWRQGGRLLILGGPLFAHLVEKQSDKYVIRPLGDQVLDAAISGKMHPIVMEGFVPSYKIYETDVQHLKPENQPMVVHAPALEQIQRTVCSCVRTHGSGYHKGIHYRYIPLVSAFEGEGRAEGRRGAPVYMMLSDVGMKRPGVDGNHFGYVLPTNHGGCAAGIGLKDQNLMRHPGMRETLSDLLQVLEQGVYLFEAGAEKRVARKGDQIIVGATVLNQQNVYVPVELILSVRGESYAWEERIRQLVCPADMTDISCAVKLPECGDYQVQVDLVKDGKTIDSICSTILVPDEKKAAPDEFVRIENGDFILGGQKWYPFGINYWPLYYPGLERDDYWNGWLADENYDPLEVERDLDFIKDEMHLNCLFTRIDGQLYKVLDNLKDFLIRCARHNLKVSLSYCNVTSPLNYQPEAFRLFMREADLLHNPTIFTHDIAWEVGPKFFEDPFQTLFEESWEKWIVERYGSIENAEKDWNMPVDRSACGRIIAPPLEQFLQEGPWRVKVCAYRRFIDDYASRKWNDTVSDMRKVDPDHLIAYRMGRIAHNTAALTATNKHTDFSSPEGYDVSNDENGMYGAEAIALVLSLNLPAKPIVWSEYGFSLTNVVWRKLEWDNEHSCPYHWKEIEQTEYLRRLYKVFEKTNVRGSAPWWYPGGFRRVEMSDFGFVGQDGLLRPGAKSYVALSEWFMKPRVEKQPDEFVTFDPDEHAIGWSYLLRGEEKTGDKDKPLDGNGNPVMGEIRGIGPKALKKADEQGKRIAFRTPGTGTTSVNMPRLAVGNVPLNGTNPAKYLNAEFNNVTEVGGHQVENGGTIHRQNGEAIFSVSVGNLQEATWIHNTCSEGQVMLAIDGPEKKMVALTMDVRYLQDASFPDVTLSTPGEYTLRMYAKGISKFGEVWHIHIV